MSILFPQHSYYISCVVSHIYFNKNYCHQFQEEKVKDNFSRRFPQDIINMTLPFLKEASCKWNKRIIWRRPAWGSNMYYSLYRQWLLQVSHSVSRDHSPVLMQYPTPQGIPTSICWSTFISFNPPHSHCFKFQVTDQVQEDAQWYMAGGWVILSFLSYQK